MKTIIAAGLFALAKSSHYERPPCQSDEVDVQVQGLQGEVCAPKCSGTTCPTDLPEGATAKAQCVLEDSSTGDKYCALTCFAGGCPTGSTCQHAGLVGICMYDKTKPDAANDPSSSAHLGGVAKSFEDFVHQFGKKYDGPAETERRFRAFVDNMQIIEDHNNKGTNSYTLGVTPFADLTADEFKQSYLGYIPPAKRWVGLPYLGTHKSRNGSLPSSVDWRTKGAVTPVKNQGQCGSCWAFSTTGSLEGAWQIASGNLVSLSEQQLVDCAKSFGEQGCNGGEMDSAFQYVQQNGLDTEDSYSYTAKGGTCRASSGKEGLPKGAVTGYKDVEHSEQALMSAVAQQPVSIAIEADKSVFQLYKSGVLTGNCGTALDHGVLAVGYGTENGKDYWLVKNSWGAMWGSEGYIKLLRGKGASGECGILMQPSYPVVSGKPGPSPPPSPPSPPTPPSPSSGHYEKPPCRSDEVDVRVQGLDGETCSPKCQGMTCPTDVPAGTTAQPQCVLQDSSTGDKYCALTCFAGGCPAGAACRHAGLVGLCMYDNSDTDALKLTTVVTSESIINI